MVVQTAHKRFGVVLLFIIVTVLICVRIASSLFSCETYNGIPFLETSQKNIKLNLQYFLDISTVVTSSCSILVAAFIILCAASYWQMTLTRTAKMVNRFPHVPQFPIIGSTYFLLGNSQQISLNIGAYTKKYGRCAAFWGAHIPYIFITEAETAQKFLSSSKCIEKGRDYKHFKWLFGNALFLSCGKIWREDRRLLNPAFKQQNFNSFLANFNKHTRSLLEVLHQKFTTGTEINDLHPILCSCLMGVVSESTIGENIVTSSQFNADSDLLKTTHLAIECFRRRMALQFLNYPFIWNALGFSKDEWQVVRFFEEILASVITQRKVHEPMNSETVNNLETASLIEVLFNKRSNEDIKSQILGFFSAGFETTATVMNFTLYLLAVNTDFQKKVHEELDAVFGQDRSSDITFADLSDLKYLEMCIQEGMRLFPPIPMFSRIPDTDIALDNGLVIPKGCDVMLSLYELHRDPRTFPDPEKFDPQRFCSEMCANRNRFAYIPFSAGPRNCIGQKYAMLQMKIVMANILRNFRVSSLKKRKDLSVKYLMILEPSEPIPLTLTKRALTQT